MSETRDGGRVRCVRTLDWREPLEVAAGLAMRDGALCLLSDPALPGSRSFVAVDPEWSTTPDAAEGGLFAGLTGDVLTAGVVGLAGYDAGARVATGPRETVWPDLMLARYAAILVFDHDAGEVRAIGWGEDEAAANDACDRAQGWMSGARSPDAPPPPAPALIPDAEDQAYLDAVAEVVARIRAGDLFQANIARGWMAVLEPEADPFDVFVRLARGGAAPYGAFWRLGERALVSNSPELFLTLDAMSRRIETRPIKGTRPRDADPVRDAAHAADLLASAKDRAENLMIVDLMRNDLSRVCEAGSVRVEKLFAQEALPTVHHLVSTVSGRLAVDHDAADLLQATFPPGSITGAPKHQAMKVIAAHEPPRGAWCGSLFLMDEDANLTASVLIRTASFERIEGRWRVRTQAGAGIVADSDPAQELAETEVKIGALRRALTG
ncbi:Aminodeoxychorismate synthase component 1 [Brevundimonas sp. NIBR10]|uniref:anthranilate synthase component I family protein n=1 Tax=Brevundimonas sp. NIBR10 TaxID=3015997 RepID=UPI0022F18333|nr:chorismate-binding protein [Brevundimonas sp. NIBR10]WGM46056.1 Aminodeoxychorismate synthase component 1 [Brevundimonas sp. NIBR10]